MLDINNNTYMHYVLYWLSICKHSCITSYIGHQQSRYGRIHFGSSVVVSGMSSGKHVVLQDLQRFVASAARRRSQQSMWHSLSMRYVALMVCAILGDSDQVSLPAISERVRTMLEPADRARRRVPYILMPIVLGSFTMHTFSIQELFAIIDTDYVHHHEPERQQQVVALPSPPHRQHQLVDAFRYGGSFDELRQRLLGTDLQLVEVQQSNREFLQELRKETQKRTYWQNQAILLRNRCNEKDVQMRELVEQVNFRGHHKRKVTTVGGYSLAKKRNIGQVSAEALVLAVAGDALNGGLKDRHIVTHFEHRAALAQRVLSQRAYLEIASATPSAADGAAEAHFEHSSLDGPVVFEIHGFCGDSTNQAACDKEKLHIAEVSSCAVNVSPHLQSFQFTRSVCDCQVVNAGTGAELFEMAQKEMRSVHCPTWTDKLAEVQAGQQHQRLSVYLFGFDHGPENTRMTKLVREQLNGVTSVMTLVSWCLLHQMHLIVRQVLDFIDYFEWDEFWDGEAELQSWNYLPNYSVIVSGVSSAWRCPGSVRKLAKVGRELLTTEVWKTIGDKIPGRVVRGRWGSIDAVERIIAKGSCLLAEVFKNAFDNDRNRTDAAEDLQEDACNTDAPGFWRVQGAKYKVNSVNALRSDIFQITCLVSFSVKGPLMHFLYWAQARNKAYNKSLKHDEADYGSTPMSELVCGMADSIAENFGKLLVDDNLFLLWCVSSYSWA